MFFNRATNLFFVILLNLSPWAQPSFGKRAQPAPHKAFYTLSLGASKTDSSVMAISGKMSIGFEDVWDGWVVQKNSDLCLTLSDGEKQDIQWNFVTWEAKNGLEFHFNMHRFINSFLEDDVRGQAYLDPKTGALTVVFQKPYYSRKRYPGKPGRLLFPTGHLIHILKSAKSGKKMVSHFVFDGTNQDGPTHIDAFIGRFHKPDTRHTKGRNLAFWPIHLSAYAPESPGEKPDWQNTLNVTETGILTTDLMDFGPYTIKGTLDHFILLAPDTEPTRSNK